MPRSASLASQTASCVSVFGRPGTCLTSRAFTSQHSHDSSSKENGGFQEVDVASMTTRVTPRQSSQPARPSSDLVVVAKLRIS
jgi:hypothetical protein